MTEPTAAKRNLLAASQNLYPNSALLGGGYVGRPGFAEAEVGVPLGSLGVRRVQLLTEFVKLDGTIYRVAVVGGKFYTYAWGGATFTEQSLGALTLSGTARIYAVAFADQLILTDGVNKPIAWDGTTFTELTNCPVIYGPMWVFYSKLFGIKATERGAIVWSEEAAANLGYEAGGYNNAWTLGQTDQDPLTAGVGLNEAMVVFRARSMTQILGAVNSDFQASGTRDGISETIGTTSPDSVIVVGRTLFFVDADGRPQRYVVNGGIDDAPYIWENAQTTVGNIQPDALGVIQGRYHPTIDLALFAVPASGFTDPTFLLGFDGGGGEHTGVWSGFPMTTFGFWTDATNRVRMVHGNTDGIPYIHGVPGGGVYNDGFAAGDEPIEHFLECGTLGYDVMLDKHFDRVDVGILAPTSVTDVRVRVATSKGISGELAMSVLSGVALWDVAIWDVDVWSSPATEQHGDVGVSFTGRWVRVQLRHAALGEGFGVVRIAVQAYALGTNPWAP